MTTERESFVFSVLTYKWQSYLDIARLLEAQTGKYVYHGYVEDKLVSLKQ